MNRVLLMTVGTNAKSYINRFEKYSKKNGKITSFKILSSQIELLIDGCVVDNFTSQVTMNQFLRTLEAFGFIEKGIGFYSIKQEKKNLQSMTDAIFAYSDDRKVRILRQTRIVSLLLYMNSLTEVDFQEMNFQGLKGNPKYVNVLRETSPWEKEVSKNKKTLKDVLERVKKYEFTKN